MNRSVITRAITTDGSARLIFADSTEIVKCAAKIHGTSKTAQALLGRCLTAASLMGSLLKGENDSLTLRICGDGPAGNVVCVSDYKGNVRGYLDNPLVELPPNNNKLNVGGAVGKGVLYVIRDLGMNEPYVGSCQLVSGEIAEDITQYFAVSEQTPSVCALGVRMNKENICVASAGYLLQLLPGADESIISVLESNITAMTSLSELIAGGKTAEDIISEVFKGIEYELFDEIDVEYRCTCEREKYRAALISLGKEELSEMINEKKPIEACCSFCGEKYTFELSELEDMLKDAERKEA